MRLGVFDPADQQPYRNASSADVCTAEHSQLALDAARQGLVLLKNVYIVTAYVVMAYIG